MSKVYEALRQKELETSADPGLYVPAYDQVEDAGPASVAVDLGVTDRVLRAALAAVETEHPGLREAGVSLPGSSKREAQTSANAFRRLELTSRESSRLVFQTEPHGLAAEQFRFLRRNLEQKFPTGGVLLMTSPAPRDGKTLTTLNLSTCLADSDRSVLLLEADIRQPSIGRVLDCSSSAPGIEDVLAGVAEPSQAIHRIEELSLCVSMVATPPADPSHLVGGDGARKLVAWARRHFDWVVIDSPPALPAADVSHLASLADATLLVVRAQSTPRDLVVRSVEMLGNHLFGVVLNEATIESNPYYRFLTEYRQKTAVSSRRGSSKAKTEAATHLANETTGVVSKIQ